MSKFLPYLLNAFLPNFTKVFFGSRGIDNFEEKAEWLNENGGYCDCEVLANVEEKFDDNAIL